MSAYQSFRCLLLALIASSTGVVSAQQNDQEKSSTEIQAIQTRQYEKPYKQVFRAVVSVLQDNKYKVNFTDMNAGLITASGSPQMSENMNAGVAFIPFIGGFLSMGRVEQTESWTVSGTVEELEGSKVVLVRLVITSEKMSQSFLGNASDKAKVEDLTSKPEIYQNLFAKIDKALFIREAVQQSPGRSPAPAEPQPAAPPQSKPSNRDGN